MTVSSAKIQCKDLQKKIGVCVSAYSCWPLMFDMCLTVDSRLSIFILRKSSVIDSGDCALLARMLLTVISRVLCWFWSELM